MDGFGHWELKSVCPFWASSYLTQSDIAMQSDLRFTWLPQPITNNPILSIIQEMPTISIYYDPLPTQFTFQPVMPTLTHTLDE